LWFSFHPAVIGLGGALLVAVTGSSVGVWMHLHPKLILARVTGYGLEMSKTEGSGYFVSLGSPDIRATAQYMGGPVCPIGGFVGVTEYRVLVFARYYAEPGSCRPAPTSPKG
jgi:hypothetical protein